MPTRVTFLVPFAFGMGGIPRTVFRVGGELAARGHEVEVVSVVRRSDRPFFDVHPDIALSSLIDLRDPKHPGRTVRRPRESTGWRAARRRALDRRPSALCADAHHVFSALTDRLLERQLASITSGVVIATRPELAVAAARWARPGVVTVFQEHNAIVDRGPGILEAITAVTAADGPGLDVVLALTEPELDRWRPVLGPSVGHLGVMPVANSFDPGPGSTRQNRTVIAAGRLKHQKGFDLLIDAWAPVAAAHPDWTLEIHGQGSMRAKLLDQIARLGLEQSVRLPGASADMQQVMTSGSVFALSSRFEGFGLVLLEAMTQGVPVVSFDCPEGPAILIEDGVTGLLVPDGVVPALSAGLRRLVEDEGLRHRLGDAGRIRAAEYDVAAVADRWEALFSDLRLG